MSETRGLGEHSATPPFFLPRLRHLWYSRPSAALADGSAIHPFTSVAGKSVANLAGVSTEDRMSDERFRIRAELYRLLLDEESGVASSLVPRMLADPDSLTPEIRWCLLYLIRGIGYLAARNDLLGQGGLLDTLAEEFEIARCRTRRQDGLWYSIVEEDPHHWVQRYESTDVHYSLDELLWLNEQLGRLWEVERQRLALEEPPIQPLALRRKPAPPNDDATPGRGLLIFPS